MICEFCKAELSAGDISVIPDGSGDFIYKVICHNCDKVQSSTVHEKSGKFFVFVEVK
jgi:hypothetical protein